MTDNRLTFDDRETIRNCRDMDIETDVAQRCLVALEAMEKQDAENIELLRKTVAVAKGLEKRLVLVHYLVTQTGAENARACGTDLHQGGPNTIDFCTVTCPDCLRAEWEAAHAHTRDVACERQWSPMREVEVRKHGPWIVETEWSDDTMTVSVIVPGKPRHVVVGQMMVVKKGENHIVVPKEAGTQ